MSKHWGSHIFTGWSLLLSTTVINDKVIPQEKLADKSRSHNWEMLMAQCLASDAFFSTMDTVILLQKIACIKLAEYLPDFSSWCYWKSTTLDSAIHIIRNTLFKPKQVFLLYMSTRATHKNPLLNHSSSCYRISQYVFPENLLHSSLCLPRRCRVFIGANKKLKFQTVELSTSLHEEL